MSVKKESPKLTLLFIVLSCEITTSEIPRPRGVSLSRAPLYTPDKDFTCFDGSKTIPFSHVNDDYCDCQDASDEPGTSACPHGVFHCSNAGHKPLNVASSRVNDGICDCCDGSDEYVLKTCLNSCLELGRAAREEAQRRSELVKSGKQVKAEMSRQGIQMKEERKSKLDELLKNKEEAQKIKDEKLELKREAEELENAALEYYRKLEDDAKQQKLTEENEKNKKEALESFERFDSNQDGILDISELQSRQTFDKDRNGEVSEEEAKYFLNNENTVDKDTFIEKSWPLLKPFLMMDAGLFKPPADQEKVENEETQAEDMQEDEENEEHDEESDHGEEELEEETPHEDEEADEVVTKVPYDEETQELVEKATEARNQFTDAETQLRNLERDVRSIEESLDIDFGAEEEYAPLKGECFEYTDHEYVYKLCPFDKTSQTPVSSGSEIRLGTWGHWDHSEGKKYEKMVYDNGQGCWNGPQRSTVVKVDCGGESRVVGVSEPNRCEYMFEFETPAACRDPEGGEGGTHDEL